MEAKELRLGNLVNKNGRPHAINMLDFIGGQDSFDKFTPIQFTEELLLKCGFEKEYEESNEWSNYDSVGQDTDDSIVIEFVNREFYYTAGEGVMLSRKYHYLHELQNLCFALTGTELQIKL
jgi:hypothetical protein